jgi:membrane dipeptidase
MRWEAHTCLPLHPDASLAPLDRFRALGVDYVSVNVGMDMNPVGQILTVLAAFRTRIAAHPERFVLVSTVADIERAARAGRLAVGFDLEGSMPLLDRPEMAQVYRDLGVRQIHFAYNRDNSVAGGCHDLDHGLTPLGRRMVAAVNDAGLLMDCSHTGRRSTLEIMASSRHPVIFSHANPLALVEHGRNVTDEQIRACAATGGCVCVSGVSAFVGTRTPSAGDVARHAAYVADVAGIAHAGIGLDIGFDEPGLDDTPPGDFDREYWWPREAGYDRGLAPMAYAPLETWRELPAALERLGMSSVETEQVMGGNMMRVASAVWTS